MTEPIFDIRALVLLTALAFLVPVLLARIPGIRIPVTVGEILMGVLVGKSGLHIVEIDTITSLLGFLGLASVMFLSGLEVNVQLFRQEPHDAATTKRQLQPGFIAMGIFLLSLTGALLVGQWMADRGSATNGLAAGLVVATCGLSLIVPVLKERRTINTPLGRLILMVGVLGDFLPITGLAVLVPLLSGGNIRGALFVLAVVLAALVAYLLLRATRAIWQLPQLAHGPAQLEVRWAFALMLLFLVLAQHLGVEVVLGAFLAGVVASLLTGATRTSLSEKLDVLGFGFLTPFFFLSVGINLNIGELVHTPTALQLVPMLFGATLLTKSVPGLLLLIWFPWREALASALLLGTQMSVTIAAAELVHRAGLISSATHQAFILVAMATAVVAPVLSARLLPSQQQEQVKERWVITGGSRQALILAQRLMETGEEVVVVNNAVRTKWEARASGVGYINADPTVEEDLRRVAATATVLVAISGDEQTNLRVSQLAAEALNIPRVFAVISSPQLTIKAAEAGVQVVNPELAGVQLLANLVANPDATSLLDQNAGVRIADIPVSNDHYIDIPLREMHLPPTTLVVSVRRGDEKIIPHGDTRLHLHDRLTVVGPADDLEPLTDMFNPDK